MSSTLSVAQFETTCDLGERRATASLDSEHLMGTVPYLGTNILTLPAAIGAKQEGLGREEFLHRQIKQTLELDIDQLELHFDAELLYPGITQLAVKRLREYQQELVFSLHLPFRYLDASCPMEKIRSASVETIRNAIELAVELQPIHYVIHLTGNIFSSYKFGLDPLIGEVMGYVEESLTKIVTLVEPHQILVENLPQIDFHYFMPVVERMGLSVCQDIGHIVLQGGDYREFTRTYTPLIKEIHLHDTERRYYADSVQLVIDHQPIGQGMLDFDMFFACLGEVGFQGSIILEIDDRRTLPICVPRIRNLMQSYLGCGADFTSRAQFITEGVREKMVDGRNVTTST